jgi:uncharacterized membrane protein SpoIIM required for sporulation
MLKKTLAIILVISLAITILQFWSASSTQIALNNLSNRIDDSVVNCSNECQSSRNTINSDNNTAKHNLIGYWIVLCLYTICILVILTMIMCSISIFAVLKQNPTRSEEFLLLGIYTFMITIFNGVMLACVVTIFSNSIKKYPEVPDLTYHDTNRVSHYSGICFGITVGHCVLALIATICFLIARNRYKNA